MIGVKIEDLKLLWNSQAILSPAEKFQNRLLYQFGSYCMRAQRNSIKPANKKRVVSQPGKPPLYHLGGGGLLTKGFKSTIFFAVDLRRKEVSIGAILLNGKSGGMPVPKALEKGGVVTVLARRWRTASSVGHVARRAFEIRPRPSAQPAFDASVKQLLPKLIAGGIMREV